MHVIIRRLILFAVLAVVVPAGALAQSSAGDIRLTFLGTGAPRPSLDRLGVGILVETDRHRLLVDSGSGSREKIFRAGSFELLTSIDHILLTHLHYDHTMGIADVWLSGWLYGRRVPLRIQGPPGTASMMANLRAMYDWDIEFRDLVGIPLAGSELDATDVEPGVIYESDGLVVTAFEVEHLPIDLETRERLEFRGKAYGFRIEYKGRSVVFSGDTRHSERLIEMGRGADVLIHETQVPSPGATAEANLANVSLSVHSTPEEAADVFSRARPRMAVFSHIIPPDVTAEQLTEATRPHYDGPLTVAHDFMQIDVGESIVISDREPAETTAFEKAGVLDGKRD